MSTTQEDVSRDSVKLHIKQKMATSFLYLAECPMDDIIATRGQLAALKRMAIDFDMSVRFEIGSDQFYQGIKKELHRELRCGLCFNSRKVTIPAEMVPGLVNISGAKTFITDCPECSR